ncbi:MAG: hypothetical protein ACXWZL_12880 [Mycobacterium sp.]|jgi:hypothetical protein
MPTDALTAQLSVLTAALDDPGTDLETILEVLVDDLSAAVSSFLGLTMTLQLDGCPLTLTTMDADLALTAGASLTLPVGRSTDGAPGGTVVFYARHPGAFVDLAADLHRVHDLDCDVYLDGHLPSAGDQPCRSGITGLAELSVVNQAIGVLITRGYTPAGAIAELGSRAAGTPRGVPEVAEHVLASTNAPPPDRSLATASRSVADR